MQMQEIQLKNLYDGKTYTVSSDKTVTVSIPAARMVEQLFLLR